jgi:NADH-quinone oxidoreductase subunit E
MAQIGKDYYEDLTPEILRDLIGRFSVGDVAVPGPQNGRYAAEPIGGLTSLKDFESGRKQYNASAQAAVDLKDTIRRIDGTELELTTPWLGKVAKPAKAAAPKADAGSKAAAAPKAKVSPKAKAPVGASAPAEPAAKTAPRAARKPKAAPKE